MSIASILKDARQENISGRVYVGVVVNNVDPLKQQRVTARIPELHGNIDDSDLPWIMKNTGTAQGNSSTTAEIAIPAVGAEIAVEFSDNSQYHGVYTGAIPSTNTVNPELTGGNYPHVVGSIDARNNIMLNDTSTGDWSMTFQPGTKVHILPSGEVQLVGAGNLSINVNGNATINATGNTNVYSQSQVNIAGSVVNLNSTAPPAVTPATAR